MSRVVIALLATTLVTFSCTCKVPAQQIGTVGVETTPVSFLGSDECADCDDYCGCGPVWTVRADAVVLMRDRPSADVLFDNPFVLTENLVGTDFEFDYRAGIDASVIRHFDGLLDAEARYLKNDSWNARATAVTNVADPFRINTALPVFLVTGRTINASYGSALDSLEANLRYRGSLATWIAGFRYVELDEHLHADLIDAITPAPTVTYDAGTQNRLYGFQAGCEATLWQRGRFSLDTVAKGGIFHNSGRQNSAYNTGVVIQVAAETRDRTSLMGEASVMAQFNLTDNLVLRGGYGLLAFEDVLLASEQVAATNFTTGLGANDNGDVFYHGGFLGLTYLH